jgi:glycosyltransferase involved in cell wall biosynthesis
MAGANRQAMPYHESWSLMGQPLDSMLGHARSLQGLAQTQLYRVISRRWKPHSRLFIVGDGASWVVSREAVELSNVASGLGLRVMKGAGFRGVVDQSVFMVSRYFLLDDDWLAGRHRVGLAYYHGLPGTGIGQFDRCYRALQAHHDRIARVQVTHEAMRDVVLSTGIDPAKVFLIRIGVNLEHFAFGNEAMRRSARKTLGLPESAFVLGTFLKDGEGWAEGDKPKYIKGPDVLLATIARLRLEVPELHVLLSGPARAYVKKGLQALGVPFKHVMVRHHQKIVQLYHASNVCLVTSRQEGGPKSVLEAMAAGTPIVSTRVGQASELIDHSLNGWLANVEEVEALAAHVITVRDASGRLDLVRREGRRTAEANSYVAQRPQWKDFFDGFVGASS